VRCCKKKFTFAISSPDEFLSASGSQALGPSQIRKLSACWNSIYRRIFNFHRWESVKVLQLMCERLDLTQLFPRPPSSSLCDISFSYLTFALNRKMGSLVAYKALNDLCNNLMLCMIQCTLCTVFS